MVLCRAFEVGCFLLPAAFQLTSLRGRGGHSRASCTAGASVKYSLTYSVIASGSCLRTCFNSGVRRSRYCRLQWLHPRVSKDAYRKIWSMLLPLCSSATSIHRALLRAAPYIQRAISVPTLFPPSLNSILSSPVHSRHTQPQHKLHSIAYFKRTKPHALLHQSPCGPLLHRYHFTTDAKGGFRRTSNTSTVRYIVATTIMVLGLSYAAVPLYRLFCQASGYGGTVTKVDPGEKVEKMEPVRERSIVVR